MVLPSSHSRFLPASTVRKTFNSLSLLIFTGCIIYIIGLFLPCYFDDRYGAIPGIHFFYLGVPSLMIMSGVAVLAFFGYLNRKNYGIFMILPSVICMGESVGLLFSNVDNISLKSLGAGFFILLAGGLLSQACAVFLMILKRFSRSIPD